MPSELAVRDELLDALESLHTAEVLQATSLDLPEGLSIEQWERLGESLGDINRASRWWIGDWVLYGEASYGEAYSQAAEATGLTRETVRNYTWVAKMVPRSVRMQGVSFSVHSEVATLKKSQQRRWLKVAAKEGLSQRDLRERIREEAALLDTDPVGKRSQADSGSGTAGQEQQHSRLGRGVPSVVIETTASGLPTAYVVPGAVVRRIGQLSVPGRDGYMRVPRDLYERLVAVLDD